MRVNAIHHTIALVRASGPASSTSTIRLRPTMTCCAPIIPQSSAACRSCSAPAAIRHPARGFCISRGRTAWCSNIRSASMRSTTMPRIGPGNSDSNRPVCACGAPSPQACRYRVLERANIQPSGPSRSWQSGQQHGSGIAGADGDRLRGKSGAGQGLRDGAGREGVNLVIVARRPRCSGDMRPTEIEAPTGTKPVAIAADVTTADGRGAILAACPDPDILINNAGGPPAGDFRKFERDDWIKALDGNMLAPIALIKATIDGMIARKFGRIVNVTSHAVKAPVTMLGAVERRAHRPDRLCRGPCSRHRRARCDHQQSAARHFRYRPAEIQPGRRLRRIPRTTSARSPRISGPQSTKRFGRPEEFGATCAFLCSVQAGYITGQNILIDGGAYPGTF